jgi:DNA-directed RNA polymerase subunit beta'
MLLNRYATDSGRTSLHDVYDPQTDDLIIPAGDEITIDIAKK